MGKQFGGGQLKVNQAIFGKGRTSKGRFALALAAIVLLPVHPALAAESAQAPAPAPAVAPAPAARNIPFGELQRRSLNPFDAYRGKTVPPPSLDNSPRLQSLVRDGKLYLTLQNSIDLALEDNLDLVIARYNLPIARMDVLRTAAGGSVRGVNTGVVSGTPGGEAAGAGAELARAARVAARVAREPARRDMVQSTLGTGTSVNSYDPNISAKTSTPTTHAAAAQLSGSDGVPVIYKFNTFLPAT
jgi:hypothetical protein